MRERVVVIGNTEGISPEVMGRFVESAQHTAILSFPAKKNGSEDSEAIEAACTQLARIGLKPEVVVPCATAQERVEQILQRGCLPKISSAGDFVIIDSDPDSLVEAVKSLGNANPQAVSLRSATIINFRPQERDVRDPKTGIRVVCLPPAAYCFPTHPTPAS